MPSGPGNLATTRSSANWIPNWILLFATLALLLVAGCGVGDWPDRQPLLADNVRIDSLHFVPSDWRFVLIDSTTTIRFRGIHVGYRCSEILLLDLDSIAGGPDFTFRPKSRIRLPSQPDCPLDSAAGRDSLLTHVFRSGDDSVILRNSSDSVTDRARLVRGKVSFDSIQKVLGIARTIDQGHLSYRDTLGNLPRQLLADTLSSCQFLNQATVAHLGGDTVKVRLSLVTLDSASVPDACQGTHADSIPVVPVAP